MIKLLLFSNICFLKNVFSHSTDSVIPGNCDNTFGGSSIYRCDLPLSLPQLLRWPTTQPRWFRWWRRRMTSLSSPVRPDSFESTLPGSSSPSPPWSLCPPRLQDWSLPFDRKGPTTSKPSWLSEEPSISDHCSTPSRFSSAPSNTANEKLATSRPSWFAGFRFSSFSRLSSFCGARSPSSASTPLGTSTTRTPLCSCLPWWSSASTGLSGQFILPVSSWFPQKDADTWSTGLERLPPLMILQSASNWIPRYFVLRWSIQCFDCSKKLTEK